MTLRELVDLCRTQLDAAVTAYNSFVSSMERNLLTATRKLNTESKNILDGGKTIPALPEA
mgnify:CR=1 FL=1